MLLWDITSICTVLPPCQAISNASRRDASEGMPLVMHFLELVDNLEPDSWSMENVPPMKKLLPSYVPATIINSAELGIPQQRRRCFLRAKVG